MLSKKSQYFERYPLSHSVSATGIDRFFIIMLDWLNVGQFYSAIVFWLKCKMSNSPGDGDGNEGGSSQ